MRNLTENAKQSIYTLTTDEVWLALLEMDIDGNVFYIVANAKNAVTSQGQIYTPYPFSVVLPADTLESIEQVQIEIDNIDLLFVDALRAASRPISFILRLALASTPDVIEIELTDMESESVGWDAAKITATLSLTDTWNSKYPSKGGIYDPSQFPGLF